MGTTATSVEVRDAKGKLVSSTKVAPKTPTLLRSTNATLSTAKDNKRKLVVTAGSVRLPAGSHLVQKIQVFSGKKLVRTIQRDRAWRGGTKRWTKGVKLKDGTYRVQLVTAAVVLRDGIPVSDVVRRTMSFRLALSDASVTDPVRAGSRPRSSGARG